MGPVESIMQSHVIRCIFVQIYSNQVAVGMKIWRCFLVMTNQTHLIDTVGIQNTVHMNLTWNSHTATRIFDHNRVRYVILHRIFFPIWQLKATAHVNDTTNNRTSTMFSLSSWFAVLKTFTMCCSSLSSVRDDQCDKRREATEVNGVPLGGVLEPSR